MLILQGKAVFFKVFIQMTRLKDALFPVHSKGLNSSIIISLEGGI